MQFCVNVDDNIRGIIKTATYNRSHGYYTTEYNNTTIGQFKNTGRGMSQNDKSLTVI